MNRHSHFFLKGLIILFCFIYIPVDGQIRINEFLAYNTSFNPDPDFQEYSDWIEIYNDSDSAVNLSGYSLTDDLTEPLKWIIPAGIEMPSKSYLLIWMDGRNTGLHAPFKLNGPGEQIGLFNMDGIVLDSITYEHQYSNISYGRLNTTGEWYFFSVPTPGGPNNTRYYSGISSQPTFSIPGGFHSAQVMLKINNPTDNGVIRYTTNGAEPDSNSTLYSGPFPINETTVIRTRIFEQDKMPGKTVSQTYFISEPEHDLPVLSISTDPVHLWDTSSGIYVNYDEDWEKPCGFEYFNPAGTQEFSLNAGLKIFGGTSRARAQKSFSIYARNRYGDGTINYPLLPGRENTEIYKSFILRNSANDWSGSWRGTMFRDALIHTLVEGQMDIDYQSYQPAVIYLNGEYWGILNIRDKHNEDYCELRFGADRDSIDIIKHNEVVAGDSMLYHEMMTFLENNDLYSDDMYQVAASMIDIEEFINYMIAEIYSCNIDWPGNNYRLWRSKAAGGKWRWMMFDTEFGFNGFQWAPVTTNMLVNKALDPDMDDYVNKGQKAPWATRVFIKLTQNQQFVNQFVSTYLSHIYTTYDPERVERIVDSLKNNLLAEMPRHIDRWSDQGGIISMPEWENNIEGMKTFGWQRPAYALQHLKNTFGIEDSARVNLTLAANHGRIILNGILLDQDPFSGDYYLGLPVDLDVSPDYGYVFKEWRITYADGQQMTLIPGGSEWKYLDDGSDQGMEWIQPDFDDAGWKSGTAKFGYGDGNEQTLISYGPDDGNKFITYYFRTEFNLEDPETTSRISINLLRDDGAIVFINGVEATRSNMTQEVINYQTLSLNAITDNDESDYIEYILDPELFVEGRNVIAVEVHQASAGSSDMGFDLVLSVTRSDQVDPVTITDRQSTITLTGDVMVTAILEEVRESISLKINELMASNSTTLVDGYGDTDDWIEIINTGIEAVDLGGLYMTDSLADPGSWMIPDTKPDSTTLQPGDLMILWADGEPDQGILHLGFKLSRDGEQVGLFKDLDGSMVLIDSVSYPPLLPDLSLARHPDGTGSWEIFNPATPGMYNYHLGQNEKSGNPPEIIVFPNPTSGRFSITLQHANNLTSPQGTGIRIYNHTGQLIINKIVPSGFRFEADLSEYPSGIYLIRINYSETVFSKQIILVR